MAAGGASASVGGPTLAPRGGTGAGEGLGFRQNAGGIATALQRGRATPSVTSSRARPRSFRAPPVQMPENTRRNAPGISGCPVQWRCHSGVGESEACWRREAPATMNRAPCHSHSPSPRGPTRAPRPAAPAAATPERCRGCHLRHPCRSVVAHPAAACGTASAAPPQVRRRPMQRKQPRRHHGQRQRCREQGAPIPARSRWPAWAVGGQMARCAGRLRPLQQGQWSTAARHSSATPTACGPRTGDTGPTGVTVPSSRAPPSRPGTPWRKHHRSCRAPPIGSRGRLALRRLFRLCRLRRQQIPDHWRSHCSPTAPQRALIHRPAKRAGGVEWWVAQSRPIVAHGRELAVLVGAKGVSPFNEPPTEMQTCKRGPVAHVRGSNGLSAFGIERLAISGSAIALARPSDFVLSRILLVEIALAAADAPQHRGNGCHPSTAAQCQIGRHSQTCAATSAWAEPNRPWLEAARCWAQVLRRERMHHCWRALGPHEEETDGGREALTGHRMIIGARASLSGCLPLPVPHGRWRRRGGRRMSRAASCRSCVAMCGGPKKQAHVPEREWPKPVQSNTAARPSSGCACPWRGRASHAPSQRTTRPH